MPFYLKVQKETLEPFTVLFMRRKGAYGPENRRLMDRMKEWAASHDLWNGQTTLLGIPWDNPSVTKAEECRYDVCMVWDEEAASHPEEIARGQIGGGLYAVFLLEHTAEAVQAAWSGYPSALLALGCIPDETRPVMERYRKKLVDQHRCELCVPVLK